ncbi:MAG: hypothetical protein K2O07_04655, partial [Alistipes sp.]|nr:hypothetical protein [Alistipes sp.]
MSDDGARPFGGMIVFTKRCDFFMLSGSGAADVETAMFFLRIAMAQGIETAGGRRKIGLSSVAGDLCGRVSGIGRDARVPRAVCRVSRVRVIA